jgi:hypothetical protein
MITKKEHIEGKEFTFEITLQNILEQFKAQKSVRYGTPQYYSYIKSLKPVYGGIW